MLIFHAPLINNTVETIQRSTYSGSSIFRANRPEGNPPFKVGFAHNGNNVTDTATWTSNLGKTSKLSIAFWWCPITALNNAWSKIIGLDTQGKDGTTTLFRMERCGGANNYKWFNNSHGNADLAGIGAEWTQPINEWRHIVIAVDISSADNNCYEQWIYNPKTKTTEHYKDNMIGGTPAYFKDLVYIYHPELTTTVSGSFNDLRIYNHMLSQFEVEQLHKRLLVHYSFDDDPNTKYQKIEYIQSTGTQYINTGVYPTGKTRVVADWAYDDLEVQSRIFGCRDNPTLEVYISGASTNSYAWKDGEGQWASTGTAVDTNRRTYDLDGANKIYKIGYDNYASSSMSSYTFTETSSNWLMLFGTNINGTLGNSSGNYVPGKGKLYGCKIYENNTLIRDFIPCLNRLTYMVGLYDKVNDKFYENAGTGSFTKGPTILEKI